MLSKEEQAARNRYVLLQVELERYGKKGLAEEEAFRIAKSVGYPSIGPFKHSTNGALRFKDGRVRLSKYGKAFLAEWRSQNGK